MDVRPLRNSRDFRWVFTSGLVTYLGSMVTFVALPYQVAAITGSFVAVGLIGLAELVPLVVFGLWGGAVADAVDRRRMVILTEVAMLLLSSTLLVNALLPEPQLWVLYLVAMLVAAVDGLQRPSLEAIIPRVVAHDELAAAGALNSLKWQVGSIAGPALGGLLIAAFGVWSAYAFDAATFLVSVLALWRLRSIPPGESAEPASLRRVWQGMQYAWSRKDLLGTYAVDLMAMFFAFPYALFPFLAEDLGAPWVLGFLYSAGAVGSLLATLTSGWTSHVHHHGRAVLMAAIGWGLAIAGVGLSSSVWLVLLLLGLAGAADMISGLFRMLIWNQTIPDELRGRMAGIELLSYSLGPTLGQVRASGVAALTSLRTSLVSGGLLCAIGGVGLAVALPSLWRYDERTDANAVREREVRAAGPRESPDRRALPDRGARDGAHANPDRRTHARALPDPAVSPPGRSRSSAGRGPTPRSARAPARGPPARRLDPGRAPAARRAHSPRRAPRPCGSGRTSTTRHPPCGGVSDDGMTLSGPRRPCPAYSWPMPTAPPVAPLTPGRVSPRRPVPATHRAPRVRRPAPPSALHRRARSRTPRRSRRCASAGKLAAQALAEVGRAIAPGVTTDELDRIGHEFLCDHGAYPSTLGYRGFPKSLCSSLNEVICHGIPDDTRPARRRHLQHRHHRLHRRGARRHQRHVPRRRGRRGGRACSSSAPHEATMRGHPRGRPGRPINVIGRVIESYAQAVRLRGRARLHRSRDRHGVPHRPGRPALRRAARPTRSCCPG